MLSCLYFSSLPMLFYTPISKHIRKKTITTTTLQTKTIVSDSPSGDATISDELFREFSPLRVSFAGGLIGGNWRFSVSEPLSFSCFKEGLLLLFDEYVLVSSRCSSRLSILEDWGFLLISLAHSRICSLSHLIYFEVFLFSCLRWWGLVQPLYFLHLRLFKVKKKNFSALSFKLKR